MDDSSIHSLYILVPHLRALYLSRCRVLRGSHRHHLPDRGLLPRRPYHPYLCVGLANLRQVFEATLMYLNVLILNLFHPGRFLPKNDKIYLDAQGQEVESAGDRGGWDDDRPWYITLFDPFNLQGLIRGYKESKAAKQGTIEGDLKV